MKRFLVTGSGRSGTRYTATLFNALDVPCGHEDVFGRPQGIGRRPIDWKSYQGDASWLAVPLLPLDEVVVLHQVRHPLDVVRSLVGTGVLREDRNGRFPRFLRKCFPEVLAVESEIERAAWRWRILNERIEPHAAITYRLEDLDTDLMLRLCSLLEVDRPQCEIAEALEQTSTTVNHRPREKSVQWEMIAPIVEDLAARYGYAPRG